jgi:hypothetical protein
VISAANASLKRDFPLKPFAIRHKLAGHPLLTLPRIAYRRQLFDFDGDHMEDARIII